MGESLANETTANWTLHYANEEHANQGKLQDLLRNIEISIPKRNVTTTTTKKMQLAQR